MTFQIFLDLPTPFHSNAIAMFSTVVPAVSPQDFISSHVCSTQLAYRLSRLQSRCCVAAVTSMCCFTRGEWLDCWLANAPLLKRHSWSGNRWKCTTSTAATGTSGANLYEVSSLVFEVNKLSIIIVLWYSYDTDWLCFSLTWPTWPSPYPHHVEQAVLHLASIERKLLDLAKSALGSWPKSSQLQRYSRGMSWSLHDLW